MNETSAVNTTMCLIKLHGIQSYTNELQQLVLIRVINYASCVIIHVMHRAM